MPQYDPQWLGTGISVSFGGEEICCCPGATGGVKSIFPKNPIPDRRHPRQPTGYHAIPVGLFCPLLPKLPDMLHVAQGRAVGSPYHVICDVE